MYIYAHITTMKSEQQDCTNKYESKKNSNNGHAKVDGGKPNRPHSYTKHCRQLRNAESCRKSAPGKSSGIGYPPPSFNILRDATGRTDCSNVQTFSLFFSMNILHCVY